MLNYEPHFRQYKLLFFCLENTHGDFTRLIHLLPLSNIEYMEEDKNYLYKYSNVR